MTYVRGTSAWHLVTALDERVRTYCGRTIGTDHVVSEMTPPDVFICEVCQKGAAEALIYPHKGRKSPFGGGVKPAPVLGPN